MNGKIFSRWLSTSSGQILFWMMPLARMMMSGLVLAILLSVEQRAPFYGSLLMLFYVWIGWTAVTTVGAVVGQPLQLLNCRLVVAIDALLAAASAALLRGDEGATIAFALCVTIFATGLRIGRKLVFGTFAITLTALISRDLLLKIIVIPSGRVPAQFGVSELITGSLQIVAIFGLILWCNRTYLLWKFDRDFSSIQMLSLERSFEFDLQAWINAMSALFAPARAACLMNAPTKNAAGRYFQQNLEAWQSKQDQESLIAAFRALPKGCSLFDCELNQIMTPDQRMFRPFDENEHSIARVLYRANIKAAFVQPMQIDRSRGGIICAIGTSIDAVKIAESIFLGRHITEMTEFLNQIATAERNFIADAHDVARRDLHDGVLQSLAALRMRLLLLAKRKDVVETPIEHEIRKTVDIVKLEQSRLRGFLENSESVDHTVNLVSQLDLCMRSISLQWSIVALLKSDEPAIPVDTETSQNIEYLLREVVANAARHAKSTSLTISLSLKQDALMIAVTDLNPTDEITQGSVRPALTLKSASLRDRLRLVNGEAYAEGLGKGILLSIRIPMQQVDDA
jgi:signal transduction histidine kinase